MVEINKWYNDLFVIDVTDGRVACISYGLSSVITFSNEKMFKIIADTSGTLSEDEHIDYLVDSFGVFIKQEYLHNTRKDLVIILAILRDSQTIVFKDTYKKTISELNFREFKSLYSKRVIPVEYNKIPDIDI